MPPVPGSPDPDAPDSGPVASDAPPAGAAMSRRPRIRLGRVAALVVVIATVAALGHSSPLLRVSPGPTPELTRALAGPDANPALATGGRLHFTTIEAAPLTWFGVLRCKVTGCQTILGGGSAGTVAAMVQAAATQMADSQAAADTAARAFTGPRATHPRISLRVDTGQIGGPSAGLMLAVADVDALTDGDLTAGKVIAGTGTITAEGTVGPIAGIADKVAGARRTGATVFFAPTDQAAAASAAAPAEMAVVPVGTLADAVGWLCHAGAASTACR